MLEAIVTSTTELDDHYDLETMNERGTLLAVGSRAVRASYAACAIGVDGATRWWAAEGELLAGALSAADRVALLVTRPIKVGAWPTSIRVVAVGSTGELQLDATRGGRFAFHYSGGGALAWADEDALWIAGIDEESGALSAALLDLSSSELRSGTFEDPYGDSSPCFAHGATRSTCSLSVHAGQHGGWAFRATVGDDVAVRELVRSDDVTSHFVADDGSVVVLESGVLVRWSADRTSRTDLALDYGAFPHELLCVDPSHAVVVIEDGTAILVDTSAMRAVGTVLPCTGIAGYRGRTVGHSGQFATAFQSSTGRPRTTVVRWKLRTP